MLNLYIKKRINEEEKIFNNNYDDYNDKSVPNLISNNHLRPLFKNEFIPEYKNVFERKVKNFKSSLSEINLNYEIDEIKIHRNKLLNDTYNYIMNKTPFQLKRRMRINFIGENGSDAGGLLRDFFYQISKEIGNPNYSFFKYTNDKTYELNINPMSGFVESDHLNYFKFIGRIIGLALLQNQHLSVNFSYIFYKKIFNKKISFKDLIYVDPELYKNLNWLKNNDGVEKLSLTFRIDEKDCFDTPKYIELKPNGSKIVVTDSNKDEYIDLVTEYKLNNTNVKKQFESLKEGFYEIIPKEINNILNELDLKFLLTGISEIDVEDWEKNTDYEGYDKYDITIINFWKCVNEINMENRKKLLIFATGNSQIPTTGFKDLQGNGVIRHFTLTKAENINDLPISHTCINQIDLPPYKSYTQLKKKLLLAISEGINEFTLS